MTDSQKLSPSQRTKKNDNPYELQDYFKQPPAVEKINHLTSKHFTNKILTNIDTLMQMGTLGVSRKRKTVDELMDRVKMGEEEQRIMEAKAKKEQLQIELEYLRRQTSLTKSSSQQQIPQIKQHILSKQEHKKLIARLKKERMERDRTHSATVNKIQQKIHDEQEQQKLQKIQKLQNELKQRREAIEQNLEKQKKRKEEYCHVQIQSRSRLKELQHRKFVYQQIEQKYQKSIVLPSLQEKKKKLKQLREYKTFNIEEIKQHEKSYLQQKQLHASRKTQIKDEWIYQPPPKSQRLEIILEQQKMQKMQKQQEKKRQKAERLSKQEQFAAKLRQTFIPKIDPAKSQQIRNRIEKSRTTIKEDTKNLKQIGMGYLEHAKKNRKITHKTIQQMPSIERPQSERQSTHNTIPTATVRQTPREHSVGASKPKSSTNYLNSTKDDRFYQRARRRHIEKLTKQQDLSQPQRIKQLKIQSDKITQKMKQKQMQYKYSKDSKLQQDTLQLLLSSIQAKIGIIQMSRE